MSGNCRLPPVAVQAIRGRHDHQTHTGKVLEQLPMRLESLGDHGPARDNRQITTSRSHEPVRAREQIRAQLRVHRPRRLIERPGGQPQVHGPAVVVLKMFEAPAQDFAQLVHVRRLERRQARLAHADERRVDGLMRAALGGEREPRRRADE